MNALSSIIRQRGVASLGNPVGFTYRYAAKCLQSEDLHLEYIHIQIVTSLTEACTQIKLQGEVRKPGTIIDKCYVIQ